MTNIDGWEQQPGGLYLAVPRFDKTNPEHREAAASVMRHVVQAVAQTHGAAVNETGFRNNMRALYGGDIKLDLYLAKWELCQPKPICLGAALNWDTVGIISDGRAGRSTYTEDVCLLTSQLRQLIRTRPQGKELPKDSLGACLERISLQNMLERDGMFYRFGEVNADNTKMMKTLGGNGAAIGTGTGSAVLEFKELPNDLMARWPMDVKVVPLKKDGIYDPNNFLVRWKDGSHDIRFIATKGRATAVGKPRADIRPWHNGNLPEQPILENVIAAALLAIKYESLERKWGEQRPQQIMASPAIPLLGIKSDIYTSLYAACGQEILPDASNRRGALKPMLDNHIHIQNDQPMIDALVAIGARSRLFGAKPMIPGVNVLKNEISPAVQFQLSL
jgi:hypothetical protein